MRTGGGGCTTLWLVSGRARAAAPSGDPDPKQEKGSLGGDPGASARLQVTPLPAPCTEPPPACAYTVGWGRGTGTSRHETQLRDLGSRGLLFLFSSVLRSSEAKTILFSSTMTFHQRSSKKKLICLFKFESLTLFFESIFFHQSGGSKSDNFFLLRSSKSTIKGHNLLSYCSSCC